MGNNGQLANKQQPVFGARNKQSGKQLLTSQRYAKLNEADGRGGRGDKRAVILYVMSCACHSWQSMWLRL